jgi:hypothetical protein
MKKTQVSVMVATQHVQPASAQMQINVLHAIMEPIRPLQTPVSVMMVQHILTSHNPMQAIVPMYVDTTVQVAKEAHGTVLPVLTEVIQ